MPTLQIQAAAGAAASVDLSLEARLAAADAAMTVRLDEAGLGYEVNTAHLATVPLDLAEVITAPVTPPTCLPALYPTPVAAVLQHAQQLLATRGWCTGQLVGADGAYCLRGALHAAAGGNRGLENQAVDLLLEAIRRRFADAETVAAWNDSQRDKRAPLRMLGAAATLADARGL